MWAVRGPRVFGRASRRTCSGWEPAVGMGERTAGTDQLPANRVAAPPVSVNRLGRPRLVSVGGPPPHFLAALGRSGGRRADLQAITNGRLPELRRGTAPDVQL
ncbi:hypothetical protein GCM10029976_073740 [Kribbella albertanoniae]